MKPSLTPDDPRTIGAIPGGVDLQALEQAFAEASTALEKVEMLCRVRAVPGLRPALGQLRLKLGAYLDATSALPVIGSEITAQMLRSLLNRMGQEVECECFERASSCAVDLGDELASHFRAFTRTRTP